jgi:hypothetical protein
MKRKTLMANTQNDADNTAEILYELKAPQRDLIATLRKIEADFKQEREFILKHHPEEKVGDFPNLEDIEQLNFRELDVRKVFCELALRHVARRANEVQEEIDEADRKQREQNLTEMEMFKRAFYALAARVTKLEGGQPGRQPALPHVPRAEVPQFLGMPSGLGRHAVVGAPGGGGGGVRKISSGAPASAPDTAGAGFTRRQHPLDVIGGGGKR